MRCHYDCPVCIQELINREVLDVEVTISGSKLKSICIRIIRITSITNDKIAIAAVHDDGVETQKPPVAGSANRAFFKRARAVAEETVNDFHLRNKTLWINQHIRLPAIVIDWKQSRNTC